jgi:hypothetical protein
MELTFRMRSNEQPINVIELNDFQTLVGYPLPDDYRQHMLAHNGGIVSPMEIAHISAPDAGGGIAYFYPIKYGSTTTEEMYNYSSNIIGNDFPEGYIIIGKTRGGGEIIMSLNNDSTYGNTKEWYPDGTINNLSPSFTQLLNDQVEAVE